MSHPDAHIARKDLLGIHMHSTLHPDPAVEERAVQGRPVRIAGLELVVEERRQRVPVHVRPGYEIGDEGVFERVEAW